MATTSKTFFCDDSIQCFSAVSAGTAGALDDFESYTDGAALGGLANGSGWLLAFLNRDGTPAPFDSFESYSDSADLNNLAGGTDWAANFVSR